MNLLTHFSWKHACQLLTLAITLTIAAYPHAKESTPTPLSPENIPGTNKVDAEGLIQVVNTVPNLILIDSRKSQDRLLGYIEGSVSLPDTKTDCKTLAQHIPSKVHPVLFYCNGPKCGRSAIAIKVALQCGYSKVYWFRGGIEEWMAKEYPLVKSK